MREGDSLRLLALLGLALSLAGAGFFALLAAIRSDDGTEGLSAASTVAILTGIVALCGLAARSRVVAAVAAGAQAMAAVGIAVAWERMEGFTSAGGDSGSLELLPILAGIVLVDVVTVVWAVRIRPAVTSRGA